MDSQKVEDKGKDFGQKLISYLPLLTLISLGIGILNQVVFYYPFHLDILTYTSFNDILFETFSNLLKCVFCVIVGKIVMEVFLFIWIKSHNITDFNREKPIIRFSDKTGHIIVLVIAICLTAICYFFYNKFDNHHIENLITEWHIILLSSCVSIFLMFGIIPIYLSEFCETIYSKPLNSRFINLLMAGLTVLYYTIFFSILNASNISLHDSYGTYVEINSKKIQSTLNYYYIGRTKDFIFFYDEPANFTDVYQNKDVSVLSLNNNGFIKTIEIFESNKKYNDSLNNIKKIDSQSIKKVNKLSHS